MFCLDREVLDKLDCSKANMEDAVDEEEVRRRDKLAPRLRAWKKPDAVFSTGDTRGEIAGELRVLVGLLDTSNGIEPARDDFRG